MTHSRYVQADGITGGPGGQIVHPHPSTVPTLPVHGLVRDEARVCVRGHTIRAGHWVYSDVHRMPVCASCAGRGGYELRDMVERRKVG